MTANRGFFCVNSIYNPFVNPEFVLNEFYVNNLPTFFEIASQKIEKLPFIAHNRFSIHLIIIVPRKENASFNVYVFNQIYYENKCLDYYYIIKTTY